MSAQNPLGYTGINFNTQPQFITAQRPPTTLDFNNPGTQWLDNSVVPGVIYETTGAGVWNVGNNVQATTTIAGITRYATTNEVMTGTGTNNAALAADVFALAASIVVGAVPAATETTAGIAEIATQVETDAGADDSRIVTPLKLANFVAAGGFPGSFTDLTATGAVSFTGATGGITMTSTTASSFGTTGAGIDLTLDSAAGSVVIDGGEAIATAVSITASDAAGGIDVNAGTGGVDVDTTGALSLDAGAASNLTVTGAFDLSLASTAGSINITAGESAVDAIVVESTAGGVKILASGASAGEDILLTATGSSIRLVSTENVSDSIVLSSSNGGIQILAPAAAPGEDIVITSTGSSIRLTATENATDAINIEATTAGINILASGASAGEDINITATGSSVNVTSTENAALAVYLHADGGTSETIRLRADQGTAATSIDVLSDVGGISLNAGLATAAAINITSSNVGGGWTLNSGTAGVTLANTGKLSLAAAAASDITVTGAFDLTMSSSLGRVITQSAKAAADAIKLNASNAAGGITATAGTGGVTLTNTGALSLSGSGASNITIATGDLSLIDTASSIVLNAGEAVADAIQLNASNAAGGIDVQAGTGGLDVDTTGAIALDAALASNLTVTGAADLTLQSTAGAVNVISGEANLDSINVTSAGGMNIVATGAAAKDIIITNTNGSMTLTAGESVTDAMNITASGVASRVNITAGTGSIKFVSGWIVPVTSVVFGASPYTVLGTDYFISVDTSGGAVTVTLPAASAVTGRTFVIRDTGGAAAASNITIGGGGTNLVGGGAAAATKVISAAYAGATVYSNGSTWNYVYVA